MMPNRQRVVATMQRGLQALPLFLVRCARVHKRKPLNPPAGVRVVRGQTFNHYIIMEIGRGEVACSFLPSELSHQPVRRVHLPQRFENSRRMYSDGAGFLICVDVVEYQRLNIAIKNDPH